MKRLVLRLFIVTVFILGLVALSIVVFQGKLIYYPKKNQAADIESFLDRGGEVLDYTTGQGRQRAYYMPTLKQSAGAVLDQPEFVKHVWLVFGGNGSVSLDWAGLISGHTDRDSAFLLMDYPGYGESEGEASPEAVRESISAGLDALAVRLGINRMELNTRCLVLGHSLGAAAALMAAEETKATHAVLLSPFTSMLEMARGMVGTPLCYLLRHRYDNLRAIEGIRKSRRNFQISIFHGVKDQVIPFILGEKLAKVWPDATAFHRIENAGHNDIILKTSKELESTMLAAAGVVQRNPRLPAFQEDEGPATPKVPNPREKEGSGLKN